jgi:hypothetical protein
VTGRVRRGSAGWRRAEARLRTADGVAPANSTGSGELRRTLRAPVNSDDDGTDGNGEAAAGTRRDGECGHWIGCMQSTRAARAS